jgi:hypothetical protein
MHETRGTAAMIPSSLGRTTARRLAGPLEAKSRWLATFNR